VGLPSTTLDRELTLTYRLGRAPLEPGMGADRAPLEFEEDGSCVAPLVWGVCFVFEAIFLICSLVVPALGRASQICHQYSGGE
jgi:hypothetical protein